MQDLPKTTTNVFMKTVDSLYTLFEALMCQGPRHKNWFVGVRDDLTVGFLSRTWFYFLTFALSWEFFCITKFGWSAPSGKTTELFGALYSDEALRTFSNGLIIGLTVLSGIWFIAAVRENRERKTLCYQVKLLDRLFK